MFEKKNGKRFLASTMALVMLLSLAPVGALAADDAPLSDAAQPSPVDTNTQKIAEISLREVARENCSVYYCENGSTELKAFDGTIAHTDQDAPYGVVFFVAPQDGYALTEITSNQTNAEFYSIADDDQIEQSAFYTKHSTGNITPVEKLIKAGFAEDELNALVTQAKTEKNCVAAFIFSRSDGDTGNIIAELGFYAEKLATLEKTVAGVERNGEPIDLDTTKVRAGDVIEYSFTVTYDQTENAITYKNVEVTDARLTTPQNMDFTGSGTTETQTAVYTVTEQDIVEAAKQGDRLTNTATLTYTYQAPYNSGEYTVSDTATANVTTVSAVVYQYAGDVPSGADALPAAQSYEKDAAVSVAALPADVPGYTFSGWSTTDVTVSEGAFTMPDHSVTLTGTWTAERTDPGSTTEQTVDAMYFVLLPGQGVPTSGVSQGIDQYFPNASDNGGVTGKSDKTGYAGKLTEAATKLSGASSTSGYFRVDGVDPAGEYLAEIGGLGYFDKNNYSNGTYNGTLPDGLKDFNMTNKEIVWYVIKKESNGYHVDGYVKGVPIQLNYYDTFGGTRTTVGTQSLNSGDRVTIADGPTHAGWTFDGWFTQDGKTKYTEGERCTLIDSLDLYAHWTTTYAVVTHFMDADGKEQTELLQTRENLTGTYGELLSKLVVSPDMTGISDTYVYAPGETSYSVDGKALGKVGSAAFTEAKTEIHQYYYLDKTGKPGKDEGGKKTDEPDGTPDAWQYQVTFRVVNGSWNDRTSEEIVTYLTRKDAQGKDSADGTAQLDAVPAVGDAPNSGYRASGSWDKTPSVGLEIREDTVFTFTYDRRSSGGGGGSSRPSQPTVDIPDDDVPTGLNGADHYAYIIGYGSNDVRPQQQITRAEVATIFFRLLTDESREANMTKLQNYSDVKDSAWFCRAVATLSAMGIVKGYNDGSFQPNAPITRAEFAAIAARFDPDGDTTPATFSDVGDHWARDEISIAANHGWINGYEDGTFRSDQKITRAEAVTLINRVLNRLPESKEDLHEDMKTWVDNMDESAWYYLAIQEATNGHYNTVKEGTGYETWTDLRENRDWSELEK